MMLTVKVTYILELTPQEYRVVSAALRGELKEEWKDEAKALQDRLFQERNKAVKNQFHNIVGE